MIYKLYLNKGDIEKKRAGAVGDKEYGLLFGGCHYEGEKGTRNGWYIKGKVGLKWEPFLGRRNHVVLYTSLNGTGKKDKFMMKEEKERIAEKLF